LLIHDENVFEALAYRRNVGATQPEIRSYLAFREEPKRTAQDDLKTLRKFQKRGLIVRVADSWFLTPEGAKEATGPSLGAEWQPADAWILTAILNNRELADCRLPDIIAAADFMNHAIPTLVEMHGALNRLASARLIQVRKGVSFSPTETALDLLAKAKSAPKGHVLDIVEDLQKLLDCPCCGVRLKQVHWRIRLNEAMMKQAYEAYRNSSGGGIPTNSATRGWVTLPQNGNVPSAHRTS
jgi:hypothetical protein